MIALLLKKPESLNTTRKKQLKLLITKRPLLEIEPPPLGSLIFIVKIKIQAILILNVERNPQ